MYGFSKSTSRAGGKWWALSKGLAALRRPVSVAQVVWDVQGFALGNAWIDPYNQRVCGAFRKISGPLKLGSFSPRAILDARLWGSERHSYGPKVAMVSSPRRYDVSRIAREIGLINEAESRTMHAPTSNDRSLRFSI